MNRAPAGTPSSKSVPEGSAVAVTETLWADPERTVVMPLTVAEQRGGCARGYEVGSQTVTIQ